MKNIEIESMTALAEYIIASDKCAKEPDENYGAAFIAMDAVRERVNKFFTAQEFEAIIINRNEIKDILRKAGLIPE